MIGNDVIDLKAAALESNPLRTGWADKIFSNEERRLLQASADPALLSWKLWAVKESAYKAHIRCGGIPGFYPHKIVCNFEKRVALIGSHRYYFEIEHCHDRVSAYAVCDLRLLEKLTRVDRAEIVRKQGMPFVDLGGSLKPASVSHHGNFYEAVTIDDEAWSIISGMQAR